MPYFNDRVYDSGLTTLDTEGTHLYICSSEPATFAAAQTARLGTKTLGAGGIGAPAARAGGGREVTVATFSDGSVTATGSASHYAIVDETNSRLLAAGALAAAQTVTSGNTFSLPAFKIGITAPA